MSGVRAGDVEVECRRCDVTWVVHLGQRAVCWCCGDDVPRVRAEPWLVERVEVVGGVRASFATDRERA
jgi:ribosomal protein L37E